MQGIFRRINFHIMNQNKHMQRIATAVLNAYSNKFLKKSATAIYGEKPRFTILVSFTRGVSNGNANFPGFLLVCLWCARVDACML